MNEREKAAYEALIASKKYSALCPEAVERVFLSELSRHKSLKDADKAARARLHRMALAYLSSDKMAYLARLDPREDGALQVALTLHASTDERDADELYEKVFSLTGRPALILDLACGLNPIYLGAKGLNVIGYDVHGQSVKLINRWAEARNWHVRAFAADLLTAREYPASDLALFMKLLPLLKSEDKDAPMKLLLGVPAKFRLVTFPTRTLSGRGVGMEKNYAAWFEGALPKNLLIKEKFTAGGELCYLLTEETDG